MQRKGLSYNEAAATLGINKNTVGKAVRGGNLNVDILLLICNEYGLNIADFFVIEGDEVRSNSRCLSNEVCVPEIILYRITEVREDLIRKTALFHEITNDLKRYQELLDFKI